VAVNVLFAFLKLDSVKFQERNLAYILNRANQNRYSANTATYINFAVYELIHVALLWVDDLKYFRLQIEEQQLRPELDS